MAQMETLPVDPDALANVCLNLDYPDLVSTVLTNKQVLAACKDLLPYKREIWTLLTSEDPADETRLYLYLTTPPKTTLQAEVITQTLQRHFSIAFNQEQLDNRFTQLYAAVQRTLLNFEQDPYAYMVPVLKAREAGDTVFAEAFRDHLILWGGSYYIREGRRPFDNRDFAEFTSKLVETMLNDQFWSGLLYTIMNQDNETLEDVLNDEAALYYEDLFAPYRSHDEDVAEDPDDYDY